MHSTHQFPVGKALEGGHVCQHRLRLVESPNHVLAQGVVHCGFSAHRGVDHGHQGGRNLKEKGGTVGRGWGRGGLTECKTECVHARRRHKRPKQKKENRSVEKYTNVRSEEQNNTTIALAVATTTMTLRFLRARGRTLARASVLSCPRRRKNNEHDSNKISLAVAKNRVPEPRKNNGAHRVSIHQSGGLKILMMHFNSWNTAVNDRYEPEKRRKKKHLPSHGLLLLTMDFVFSNNALNPRGLELYTSLPGSPLQRTQQGLPSLRNTLAHEHAPGQT